MVYVLAWRDSYPGHTNSDPRCRRVIATANTDTFTTTEHDKFQVINRPSNTSSDFTKDKALNADDLQGGLITLASGDYPPDPAPLP